MENTPRYGDFAFLMVKQITRIGAFLDTGERKDLLLPFSEQTCKLQEGKGYVVAIIIDDITQRPIATQKYKKYINRNVDDLKPNQEVDLLVTHFTKLGANVIINNEYEGLVFSNQIFRRLKVGERLKGYIKEIREQGKVDVVLQKQGVESIEQNSLKILQYLKNCGGSSTLNDQTEPYIIYRELEMSKKAFKNAIGSLFKQKIIEIKKEGIILLENNSIKQK